MTSNLAINGFGRIGRLAARIWYLYHKDSYDLVAINTSGSMDLAGWAHLLRYDTSYGPFEVEVRVEEDKKASEVTDSDPFLGYLVLGGTHKIPVLAQRKPDHIPWHTYGAETIIESTGAFRSLDKASLHLMGGAKHVVISAPGKEGVTTSVLGVSDDSLLTKGGLEVVSNASCTTNCVAPVAVIVENSLGIQKAAMTTIHSFTDDQRVQDGSHRDLRRARAASGNIIPTSTGAATASTEVIPSLRGLFDGIAVRVPTLTGSLTDFTFLTKRQTTVEEVRQIFDNAAKDSRWHGILAATNEPLVSSDIKGRRESAIVDLSLTQVIGGDLLKVYAWYDNEWGYANRLVETAIKIS